MKGIAEEDVSVMGSDAPVFELEAESIVDIAALDGFEERFRDPNRGGQLPDDDDYDTMMGIFQHTMWSYDTDFELRSDIYPQEDDGPVVFALQTSDPEIVDRYKTLSKINSPPTASIQEISQGHDPMQIDSMDEESHINFVYYFQLFYNYCARLSLGEKFLFFAILYCIAWYLFSSIIYFLPFSLGIFVFHTWTNQERVFPYTTFGTITNHNISKTVRDGKEFILRNFFRYANTTHTANLEVISADMESLAGETSPEVVSISSVTSKASIQSSVFDRIRPSQPEFLGDPPNTIPLNSNRCFVECEFNNTGIKAHMLCDTGASASTISKRLLAEIEKAQGHKARRLRGLTAVRVFGDKFPSLYLEAVLLDVSVDGLTFTKNCPFLVMKNPGKTVGIVGCNLFRAWGVSFDFSEHQTIITFKCDASPRLTNAEKLPRNVQEHKIAIPENFTIMGLSASRVPIKYEGLNPFVKNKKLEVVPAIEYMGVHAPKGEVQLKKGMGFIEVANPTKHPITLLKGMPLASGKEIKNPLKWDKQRLNTHLNFVKNLRKIQDYQTFETDCICGHRRNRSMPLILFGDVHGFHYLNGQCLNTNLSLAELKQKRKVVCEDEHIFHLRMDEHGAYPCNWDDFMGKIKTNVRIIMSFRESISDAMEKVFSMLMDRNVVIEVVKLRNRKCRPCRSISSHFNERLFKDADSIIMYFVLSPHQPIHHQRLMDKDSEVVMTNVGKNGTCVLMKNSHRLVIYLHLNPFPKSPNFAAFDQTIYLFFFQLGLTKPPTKFTILTSFDDLKSPVCRRLTELLKIVPRWTTSDEYKIELLEKRSRIAPFLINGCCCMSCQRVRDGETCKVSTFTMVYSGELNDNIERSSRALLKPNQQTPELCLLDSSHIPDHFPEGSNVGEVAEAAADRIADIDEADDSSAITDELARDLLGVHIKSKHVDDQDTWGTEFCELEEALKNFPGCDDPDHLNSTRYKEIDWRITYDVSKLPQDPDLRAKAESILDKHNSCLASSPYSWRPIRCEPIRLEFLPHEPIIMPPVPMNAARGEVLIRKIQNLLDNNLIKVVDSEEARKRPHLDCINSFIVEHNSEQKRKLDTGEQAKGQLDDNSASHTTLYRLILDSRPINKFLKQVKNLTYLMDSCEAHLNRLGDYRCFTIIDITKAFRAVQVEDDSTYHFCFRANYGSLRNQLFRFTSLGDGWSVSPSYFMGVLCECLQPLVKNLAPSVGQLLIYCDDIIIMSHSPHENLEILDRVLELLNKAGFLVNLAKLQILPVSFMYLGFEIRTDDPQGITRQIPEQRLECFRRMKPPSSLTEVRELMGKVNHCSLHVPGFQANTRPLLNALRKKENEPFSLDEEQHKNFKDLQGALDKLQKLWLFKSSRKTVLSTDSCLTSASSSLWQVTEDGSPVILGFQSKRLPIIMSTKYSSVLRECLAVLIGLHKWERFLVMANSITIIVDLSAVVTLLKSTMTFEDSVLTRLSYRLFSRPYNFVLRHRAGRFIQLTDYASRIWSTPCTENGTPIGHRPLELDAFFEKYKDTLSQELKDSVTFTYDDLVRSLSKELYSDTSVSAAVRERRLRGLLSQLNPEISPHVFKFAEEKLNSACVSSKKVVSDVGEFYVHQSSRNEVLGSLLSLDTTKRLIPPRMVPAFTLSFISKLQRQSEKLSRVIFHLMGPKPHDTKLSKYYKLVHGSVLICRANPKQDWRVSNLRFYLAPKEALTCLGILHCMNCHSGRNSLCQNFSSSFKTYGLTRLASAVTKACVHCLTYYWGKNRAVPHSRFPRPDHPCQYFSIDVVALPPGKWLKNTCTYYLGVIDWYSRYFQIYPLVEQTSAHILQALSHIFCMMRTPTYVLSDNHSVMVSEEMERGLSNLGVHRHLLSSPHHSEGNSLIERAFRKLRFALYVTLHSFRGSSYSEILMATVALINETPLSYLRRHDSENICPSPSELFFNERPKQSISQLYLSQMPAEERRNFKEKFKKILDRHEKEEIELLKEKNAPIEARIESVKVGDIVLCANHNKKNGIERGTRAYHKELMSVKKVSHHKLTLSPLFYKGPDRTANQNDVKKYELSKLASVLPRHLQDLLGFRYYTKKDLKKRTSTPSLLNERVGPYETPTTRKGKRNPDSQPLPGLDINDDSDSEDESPPMFKSTFRTNDEPEEIPPEELLPNDTNLDPAVPFDIPVGTGPPLAPPSPLAAPSPPPPPETTPKATVSPKKVEFHNTVQGRYIPKENPLETATPAEDVQAKKPSFKEMLFKKSSPITSFQDLAKKVPVETGARSKLKINLPSMTSSPESKAPHQIKGIDKLSPIKSNNGQSSSSYRDKPESPEKQVSPNLSTKFSKSRTVPVLNSSDPNISLKKLHITSPEPGKANLENPFARSNATARSPLPFKTQPSPVPLSSSPAQSQQDPFARKPKVARSPSGAAAERVSSRVNKNKRVDRLGDWEYY